jgi:hypothetical protein
MSLLICAEAKTPLRQGFISPMLQPDFGPAACPNGRIVYFLAKKQY